MLKNRTTKEKICIGIIIAMCIANIVSYPFLPDKIPIHFNSLGQADGYISHMVFIFLFPVFTTAIVAYHSKVRLLADYKGVMICGIMLIVDVGILIASV